MPPLRRRRPILRAAAVSGGAYAYGKHRERQQQDQSDQAYSEGQQSAAAPQAPTGITSDDTARLAELGRLHDQGVLTDEEFSREKAKILGL
jgi:hypothetical protein